MHRPTSRRRGRGHELVVAASARLRLDAHRAGGPSVSASPRPPCPPRFKIQLIAVDQKKIEIAKPKDEEMARRFRARPSVGEANPARNGLAAWMGRAEVQAQRSAIQADPDWPV